MPMLVVGSNNWLRTRVPFFLLQSHDVFLFFYPNAEQGWVCGALAMPREPRGREVWAWAGAETSEAALSQAVWRLLPGVLPDAETDGAVLDPHTPNEAKRLVWLTHWVYRCQKIALRHVLALEAYPADGLSAWVPEPIPTADGGRVYSILGGGK
jgi:hypothetical protein